MSMSVSTNDLVLGYKQTKQVAVANINAQIPLMMWGPPGIGKSELPKDIVRAFNEAIIAEALKQNPNAEVADEDLWDVVDIRLALLESVDVKGYPYLTDIESEVEVYDAAATNAAKTKLVTVLEKALSFAPNKEFPRHPTKKVILFFDEINAAQPSTQLAMYQLILDRRVGEYVLPKNVSMIAAGNRESDKGGVFKMPKPLLNRFAHTEMVSNFEDWAHWAVGSGIIDAEIIGYLTKNKDKLNTFDDKSNRAFCTPRTWVMANKVFRANKNAAPELLYHLIASCIGTAVATEFVQFREIASDIPSAEDIFQGKNPKMTKNGVDISYMLITNCMFHARDLHQLSKTKEGKLSPELAKGIGNFFKFLLDNETRIGIDFVVVALTSLSKNYKVPVNRKDVPIVGDVLQRAGSMLNIVFES